MGRAKDIIVKVIPAKIANDFVKKHHYSGKVATTGRLHFGAFLDGKLHGVMTFGNSIDKRKILPLVHGTGWNEYLELNRMAFNDYLPKNSESRCFSIAVRLIKKNAPHVKWIVSFADACQCGDGSIYRAMGFHLTAIKKNSGMWLLPSGEVIADMITRAVWNDGTRKRLGFRLGEKWSDYSKRVGAKKIEGYQLRYIYLIDKSCKLTVPIIPFTKIDEIGAGMYLGKRISLAQRKAAVVQGSTSGIQPEDDGRTDPVALSIDKD